MAHKGNNLHPVPRAVVVNDDVTQLNVQCGLLRKAGLEPIPFKNVETALNAMDQDSPPALIITDLYMPGIDGWRFCRLLRSPEYLSFNHVPILVVSAIFSGDEPSQISMDLGADAFLPMPVDGRRFIALVQTLLVGEKSQRTLRVLIVEDSKLISNRLKQAFLPHGYLADTAANLKEGLARIEETLYDIAALDYHLPDGLGDGLLNVIHEKNPDCICLMMTVDPQPGLALSWMKLGAASYIHKPFEAEYFIAQCARAIRERTLLHMQDLAELRTAQLRKSEAEYRLLFENMEEGFALGEIIQDEAGKAVDFRFLGVNKAYERHTGMQRETIIGKTMLEVQPQADPRQIEAYGRVALTGEPLQFEYFSKTNGRYLRVNAFCPQRGRFVTIFEDITLRKQAGDELRKLSRAVEQSPASIIITDIQGIIEYVNPRFTKLTGYSLEEVVGKNPRILQSGRTPPENYVQLWKAITSGDEWSGDFCNKKKNGEFYWERVHISAITDEKGKISHFVAVKEDITERKEMVENLRKSEARNSALLSAVPDFIFRIRSDGLVLDYKASSNGLQIPPDQILGASLHHVLDASLAGKVMACIKKALQSKHIQILESSLKMGDSSHVFEARFKDSGPDEVTAIIRDVSERARLEQMKTDFINRVTHEWSTPVSIMDLMINLMEDHAIPEESREYWDVLKGEVNKERMLIEDLLGAGRLESNQLDLNFSSFDLVDFIQQVIQQFEHPARDKNITISLQTLLDLDFPAPDIMADQKALNRVWGNLLNNAIKFTPPGGNIHILLQRNNSGYEISISDTGIGIPSEDLPLLFTRFFRGTNAIENEIQGTGIGLFIVQSILEKHGGTINAHSELGKGSRFDVWLPENKD